jgi:hypothetical protein
MVTPFLLGIALIGTDWPGENETVKAPGAVGMTFEPSEQSFTLEKVVPTGHRVKLSEPLVVVAEKETPTNVEDPKFLIKKD